MIEVKNLTKTFELKRNKFFQEKAVIYAVNNISFSVKKGQTLGLVGESGCGKTTTIRSLLRLIEPDSGKIIINGSDISALNKKELRKFRKNIQLVFQDPYSSLNPRFTIGQIIKEPFDIHSKLKKEEKEKRVKEILKKVGLKEEHYNRYPHEFSGGQRQRIGIARAIALNPDIIILDEPVSALDVSIQGQILNLLQDLQKELNLTYIFVSHDLAVVEHFCNDVAVMYLGEIVELQNKHDLYKKPLHPYTQSLLRSIPNPDISKDKFTAIKGEIPSPENPPQGCTFHPRCPFADENCQKNKPLTVGLTNGYVKCHLFSK